jgi:hypothetical protein
MKIYKQDYIYTDANYKQIIVQITSRGAGLGKILTCSPARGSGTFSTSKGSWFEESGTKVLTIWNKTKYWRLK